MAAAWRPLGRLRAVPLAGGPHKCVCMCVYVCMCLCVCVCVGGRCQCATRGGAAGRCRTSTLREALAKATRVNDGPLDLTRLPGVVRVAALVERYPVVLPPPQPFDKVGLKVAVVRLLSRLVLNVRVCVCVCVCLSLSGSCTSCLRRCWRRRTQPTATRSKRSTASWSARWPSHRKGRAAPPM